MSGLWTLWKRQFRDVRWMLFLLAMALFGLSWLSVYRTAVIEARISEGNRRAARFVMAMQEMSGSGMDGSSLSLETIHLYWLFLTMPIQIMVLWSIARGTGAVSGDIAQGFLDVVMARPVRRATYLTAHVLSATSGMLLLGLALVAGNLLATRFIPVETPPNLPGLLRPALNLVFLGWSIYGYTLFLSSLDLVRWRPMFLSATVTLAQLIAFAIANQPDWDEWRGLNRLSVFAAFYPVEAATKGDTLLANGAVLGLVGLIGLIAAYAVFLRRDLPAVGG